MTPTLVDELRAQLGSGVVAAASIRGGDVAEAFRVDLADGRRVFVKTMRRPPPRFFSTEAAGLDWLRTGLDDPDVGVPAVVAAHEAFLALEWIDEGAPGTASDGEFARMLATIHRAGAPCFGRSDRRPTGSRQLPNDPYDTWAEAYARNRLLPLARLGHDTATLDDVTVRGLEEVAGRLDELGGPAESPARLHGDLWAGNRLVDTLGRNWLIDPAAHGGHREFDLSMMRLFGGFGTGCFGAYDEVFPLAEGWRERVPLHQLAPLAVHAIKFGGGYEAATVRALDAVARS